MIDSRNVISREQEREYAWQRLCAWEAHERHVARVGEAIEIPPLPEPRDDTPRTAEQIAADDEHEDAMRFLRATGKTVEQVREIRRVRAERLKHGTSF